MFLRKSRITIVLSLMLAVLVGFGGLAAPVLTDVSKDHWAYQAVLGLVDKGYLSVYNDGSFRGDEPVSRYLLAFVVAKMLTDLEKGTVTATDEDMSVLRQVANELRGELVPLIAALDTRVKAVEAASFDSAKAMTAERQERKAEAAGILNELDGQAKQVLSLGSSISKVETKVTELERAMAAESAAEKKLIDALKAENEAERLFMDSNKAATDANKAATDANKAEIDANKAEIDALKAQLEANRKASEAAVAELKKAQSDTLTIVAGLDIELEALRKVLSDDIGRSVAELTKALNDEAAARKKLEQEGVENLAAALSSMRSSADAEAAAERELIEQLRKEGSDGRAAISASVEQLRKAQEATDSKVDAVNKELTVIKGALGQDIDKAVEELSGYLDRESQGRKELEAKLAALETASKQDIDAAMEQLRQWAEEQHASMAAEFDGKLGEVSSSAAKQVDALSAEVLAKIDEAGKKADSDLQAAMEALRAYSNEETRVRILADEQMYAKLAELDAALGADLEKSVAGVMAALDAQKAASSQAQAAADAKLISEIGKLKSIISQEDDSTRSMVLRNVIDLQNRDSELEKSIADLRILMDEARLNITQLKDRIAAAESRLTKLEGSVDILKANLESAATLLSSVNSELSRQKILQGTLETRLADLTASTDAKFKKLEKDSTVLMEAQDIAAQEREAKLNQKITSLEQSIAKQSEEFNASLKKAQGLGITGLVIGALGLVVGIIAIFLPTP